MDDAVIPSPPDDMAPAQDSQHFDLDGLLQFQCRVVWLYPRLPRFRFKAPQTASLRLIQPRVPAEATHTEPAALSPLDKFCLVRETDERCHWCSREFGSSWVVKGKTVRLRLHWDHVVPASCDGASDITNIVPSCHLCNLWKSDRLFDTEADVRAFLGEQWSKALVVPIAAEPSSIAVIPVDEPAATVAPPVPKRPIEKPTAHIRQPESKPVALGPMPTRQLPRGTRVRIMSGTERGRAGLVDGPSRDRPDWTRVFLGTTPWRFDPRRLERVNEVEEAA